MLSCRSNFAAHQWQSLQAKCPLEAWGLFIGNPELAELANFAQLLLWIVVNQAGCEWLFSDLKNKQSDKRTCLGLEKLEKMAKVSSKGFITYNCPDCVSHHRLVVVSKVSIKKAESQINVSNAPIINPPAPSWMSRHTLTSLTTKITKTKLNVVGCWCDQLKVGGLRWQNGLVMHNEQRTMRIWT